ncbi:hypothetical protein SASPL_145131 [Salvia splendens]|uniref:TF-B3 domain-containing protein n=1 Tax=Salvia splendens TaxID=180675 RepID=A0A8X8Z740_SALSN|nr:hypothetical protein SASPL_145131 [Salvia splendens]
MAANETRTNYELLSPAHPRLPGFMKVFYSIQSSNAIRLPPEFIATHGESLPEDCTVEMPNGRKWNVKIKRRTCGWYFKQGWAEFVYRNHIHNGDFLTFIYPATGVFHITHYDFMSGCIPARDIEHILVITNVHMGPYMAIEIEFWSANNVKQGENMAAFFTVHYQTWGVFIANCNDIFIVHGGWMNFVRDNDVEVGVRCMFQLVDAENLHFRVIFSR